MKWKFCLDSRLLNLNCDRISVVFLRVFVRKFLNCPLQRWVYFPVGYFLKEMCDKTTKKIIILQKEKWSYSFKIISKCQYFINSRIHLDFLTLQMNHNYTLSGGIPYWYGIPTRVTNSNTKEEPAQLIIKCAPNAKFINPIENSCFP